MAKPINMPKLSDEMTEGKIAQWLKKEGDEVATGDVVAQVETEKATLDIEAFDPGVLLAVLCKAGDTMPVGQPIAWLGKRGEAVPSAPAEAAKTPGKREEPPVRARAQPPAAPAPAPVVAAPAAPSFPVGGGQLALAAVPPRSAGRIVASPVARRIARERGLDLRALQGSGPGGRIILQDVDRMRAAAGGAAPAPAQKPRRELPPRRTLREETVPLSPMRKAIARNLAVSKPGAPHFYLSASVDMRRAVALRRELNELGQGEVSLNDVIMKAVADALTRHPEINAAWGDEAIVRHGGVHVGMAVAVDEGLITPVIRDADKRSIFEIAHSARELASRAREKRLKPEEYQGGTFTVSNLGMFGIEAFYAIINPPEAAILSVGAVERVPWMDGESVVAMERCTLGLSGDHRVIDGAVGARFLQTLRGILESPLRLVVNMG